MLPEFTIRCKCHKPGRIRVRSVDALRAPETLKFLKFGPRALPTADTDANYWAGVRNEAKFQKLHELVKHCTKFIKDKD